MQSALGALDSSLHPVAGPEVFRESFLEEVTSTCQYHEVGRVAVGREGCVRCGLGCEVQRALGSWVDGSLQKEKSGEQGISVGPAV